MKKRVIINIIITAVLLSSCSASMQVFVNQSSNYSRKTPITITNKSDGSGALGELQFLLQSNGYKVMSMAAAKKALNLDSESSNGKEHSEVTYTTTVKSVYVIEMNYSYYIDGLTSLAIADTPSG